jgi:ATP synthase protein I
MLPAELHSRETPRQIAPSRHADPYAHKTRGMYQTLAQTSIGLELGISVILGLLFGQWLDGKLGTDPWMMLVFLGFGFTAGMRAVLRAVKKADRLAEESSQEAG